MRRRTFVATTAGLGTALLAGCAGDGGDSGSSDDGSTDGTGTGSFRLLISDRPTAIEDFDSLDVTLSSARVFRAGDDEEVTPGAVNDTVTGSPEPSLTTVTGSPESSLTNMTVDETEDEDEDEEDDEGDRESDGEGFVEFDLDSVSVDLTQVVGDRAVSVLENELDEGRYSGIELRVASAEGVVDGDAVDVMVPSNRLRIVKPFEVGADAELSFVFDIEVIQKGPRGSYNLLPVIGKSGVTGTDIEVEEVDTRDEDTTETPDGPGGADGDGGNGS